MELYIDGDNNIPRIIVEVLHLLRLRPFNLRELLGLNIGFCVYTP